MNALRILTLSLFILCSGVSAWAGDVQYQIQDYGGRHAVVILTGPGSRELTTQFGTAGQSIRISGLGVRFQQAGAGATSLISSVTQVRRDPFIDLVLNLAKPCDLSATPGISNLKLYIKAKKETGAAKPTDHKSATAQTAYSPIQVLLQPSATQRGAALKAASVALIFPETEGLQGNTELSVNLRSIALGADILWSWLKREPLEFSRPTLDIDRSKELEAENAELEKLVQELTQELVEVRQHLVSQSGSPKPPAPEGASTSGAPQ